MKIYIKGKKEKNLRYKTGRSFKKRIERLKKSRKNSEMSENEKKIALILVKNKLHFEREYNPPGLINPKTWHPLFFDFFLPAYNVLIEYDGMQHYKPLHGNRRLEDQKYRDNIKTVYCAQKGLKLLRIPYYTKDIERSICVFFDKYFPK